MIDSFKGKYNFLSNMYGPHLMPRMFGLDWYTVEHSYQAYKFADHVVKSHIVLEINNSKNAYDAKRLANKKYKKYIRTDWNDAKLEVMAALVTYKFMYNKDLQEKLLETGDEELVEGNTWHDTYWGVCNGKGENCLGKILMEVRRTLRGS